MLESGAHRLLRTSMLVSFFIGFNRREREANMASMYYWGNQYNHLLPWDTPDTKLRDKAPAYRIRVCKNIVDEFVSHLFGEERAPSIVAPGTEDQQAQVDDLLEQADLLSKLPEVARIGGLHGSVVIAFHMFDGVPDIEVIKACNCKPVFGRQRRGLAIEQGIPFDDLVELDERWRSYKEVDGKEVEFFHRRTWTINGIVEYMPIEGPLRSDSELKWVVDEAESYEHGLGFVPAVWVKNGEVTEDIDGWPLLGAAEFEIEDEINYTLSQAGRGIRYNQEPTLLLRNVNNDPSKNKILRGAGNTLQLEPDALYEFEPDASLIEMEGEGSRIAMDYFKVLRTELYAAARVYRHDAEQAAGAMSGVAIRLLKEPIVSLVKQVRPSYAKGLTLFVSKFMRASGIVAKGNVKVVWPPVLPATIEEKQQLYGIVSTMMMDELMTPKQAVTFMADYIGVKDVEKHMQELREYYLTNSVSGASNGSNIEALEGIGGQNADDT